MFERLRRFRLSVVIILLGGLGLTLLVSGAMRATAAPGKPPGRPGSDKAPFDEVVNDYSEALLVEGRDVFRYDTFGSEEFYGDVLRLHDAIKGE